ncbi:MAG: type II toxin-antitoxin system VapC family toxin [Thermoanaerobaculia bacterium]
MILLDANLLIYAYDELSPFYRPARTWLERAFSGVDQVGLSWVVLLAFLRITTHARLTKNPLEPEEALRFMKQWLSLADVRLLNPGPLHLNILGRLLLESGVRGPRVMDAHLAALAIEHRATLCTTDGDFKRFSGLRLHFPLSPARAS